MTITIDPDTCTRCGTCADVCLMSVIGHEEGELPRVEEGEAAACSSCGHCEAYCPAGAITVGAGTSRTGTGAEKFIPGQILPGPLGTYIRGRRSVREFRPEPVPRETIKALFDIARYAPSAMNGQPVEWLVIGNPRDVQKVAGLTIDWMRTLVKTDHPLGDYAAWFIGAWDGGRDIICHNAPHLLVPHVPGNNPIVPNDAIIALTTFDLAAPAFGIGTCWAGLVASASRSYEPLADFLAIPGGRVPAYAMMFGYPKYLPHQIPERKPLQISWR